MKEFQEKTQKAYFLTKKRIFETYLLIHRCQSIRFICFHSIKGSF